MERTPIREIPPSLAKTLEAKRLLEERLAQVQQHARNLQRALEIVKQDEKVAVDY